MHVQEISQGGECGHHRGSGTWCWCCMNFNLDGLCVFSLQFGLNVGKFNGLTSED